MSIRNKRSLARARIPKLPARRRDAHKGDFGRVLVVGGSRGMIGAPALVANAALRGGAGLVVMACPESIQPHVAVLCPCATSIPLPEDASGQIAPQAARKLLDSMGYFHAERGPSCVAIGPGLGRGDARFNMGIIEMIRAWSEESGTPLVIDADALNAMGPVAAKVPPPEGRNFYRAVLTPHAGEMLRLMGIATGTQHDLGREDMARTCAKRLRPEPAGRAVLVLKGAGTIVTDGVQLVVNTTGNPGMATGGSGDVLTGVIAGLISQSMELFDAAVLGTHVHGLAGDLAVRDMGQVSMIATDLLNYLPSAFLKTRTD
jgi:ADP-dependent NAD(P)H-hydrate dehydratase